MKNIWVVCGLNSSRSQTIEEFLKDKYNSDSNLNIKSAGLDVFSMGKNDRRILFTEEMAREASLILASDCEKFSRIKYNLLKNDESQIGKVHLLRIPDVFHIHRNAAINRQKYDKMMEKIESEFEFRELSGYISALSSREASELTEALYIKELYTAHLPPYLRQDKKYPFQLLHKTLEHRFPEISGLIENAPDCKIN